MSRDNAAAPLAAMLRELERTLRKAAMIDPRYLERAEKAARQAERLERRSRPKTEPTR